MYFLNLLVHIYQDWMPYRYPLLHHLYLHYYIHHRNCTYWEEIKIINGDNWIIITDMNIVFICRYMYVCIHYLDDIELVTVDALFMVLLTAVELLLAILLWLLGPGVTSRAFSMAPVVTMDELEPLAMIGCAWLFTWLSTLLDIVERVEFELEKK